MLKAAEQGDSRAQCLLGGFYLCGDGVEQDYVEAAKWYRLAAEQGHEEALERLKELESMWNFEEK